MNNIVNTSGLICMQLAACAVMSVMSLLSKNSNVTIRETIQHAGQHRIALAQLGCCPSLYDKQSHSFTIIKLWGALIMKKDNSPHECCEP